MPPRTLVLGDLHLVRGAAPAASEDLVALLRRHAGDRVVFVGDVFDLSADYPGEPKGRALRAAFEAQAPVRAALAEHVDRGGELWMVSGNHDAALGEPEERSAILGALGLGAGAAARVKTTPWFIREGGLHLEHGHLYDPDNSMVHPLASGARSLGVRFVEEFIAPTGAFRYLNANDGTPLKMLASAFSWYGVRGPYVVYKYFETAFRALAASGPFFPAAGEAFAGSAREPAFAAQHGVGADLVASLAALGAEPTMLSARRTFQRLYLDRVAATVSLVTGLAAVAAGSRRAGLSLLGAGALVMGVSWALGFDRYGGSVPERLQRSASEIAKVSGAKLVVLGHAHREAQTDDYANTGSFSFPGRAPGRPYLEIEGPPDAPRAVRRYFLRAS